MKENTLTIKPVVAPSIWLFVSSTTETAREWTYREVLGHFPKSVFGLARLFHIDASWTEDSFVPPCGNPSLDEQRMDKGTFFPLSNGTMDMAGQIKAGRLSHLRFAPLKLMELGNAKTGARNSPTQGYVLFLWNRSQQKAFFSEQIQGVLRNREQVRAIEADFDVEPVDIQANIVWAPGGTGCGIAIGCGELLREISNELNLPMTITGIKLRPGAFKSSSPQRLNANAYANDIELAAAQSGRWLRIVPMVKKEGEE